MSSSRLVLLALLAWIVGIWFGTPILASSTSKQLVIAFSCLLATWIVRRFTLLLLWGTVISSFLLGQWYVQNWRSRYHTLYPAQPDKGTFLAVITDAPDVRKDKTFLTVRPLLPVGRSLADSPQAGKILVHSDRYPTFSYGETVQVKGKIEAPEPFNNFDYPLFLAKEGIHGVVDSPKSITRTAPAPRWRPYAALLAVRSYMEQTIARALPEPEASFLAGLLMGSKRAIPDTIQEALRTTGTTHIIAISGANITMMLDLLLRFLPLYTRVHHVWAAALVGGGISLLTGASASVVRGAFVATYGRYLRLKGRRAWVTPFILSSVVLLLLFNPLLLRGDPGFQLSFAAYAGLLYGGSLIQNGIKKFRPTRNLPEAIQAPLGETMAATLGTLPLSLRMFGQFSLLAFVVNPAILWMIPFITLLGFAFIAVAWLPIPLFLPVLILWLPLHAILSLITFFSRFKFAVLQ